MARLYDIRRWRTGRLRQLEAFPGCCRCGAPATIVDHDPPHNNNPRAFFDEATWRSMCKRCHDSTTATADGGFGNTKNKERVIVLQGCRIDGTPTDKRHHWNR